MLCWLNANICLSDPIHAHWVLINVGISRGMRMRNIWDIVEKGEKSNKNENFETYDAWLIMIRF